MTDIPFTIIFYVNDVAASCTFYVHSEFPAPRPTSPCMSSSPVASSDCGHAPMQKPRLYCLAPAENWPSWWPTMPPSIPSTRAGRSIRPPSRSSPPRSSVGYASQPCNSRRPSATRVFLSAPGLKRRQPEPYVPRSAPAGTRTNVFGAIALPAAVRSRLQKELDVSVRLIYRDIETLRGARRGPSRVRPYWLLVLKPSFCCCFSCFDDDEIEAIVLGLRLAEHHERTEGIQRASDDVIAKPRAALRRDLVAMVDDSGLIAGPPPRRPPDAWTRR